MMKFKTALILATVLAAVPQLAHAQEGDAAAGEKVFKKCQACHTASEEKNKVGPYLKGVVGRQAASVDGFKYSDALKAKAAEIGAWDEAKIVEYLADPKAYIGGTSKMAFKLKDEQDRKNVAAYLATMK
jgi:cytochrome c